MQLRELYFCPRDESGRPVLATQAEARPAAPKAVKLSDLKRRYLNVCQSVGMTPAQAKAAWEAERERIVAAQKAREAKGG